MVRCVMGLAVALCTVAWVNGMLKVKHTMQKPVHKPVVHLHFHKAAGMQMCHAAALNEENTGKQKQLGWDDACNWAFDTYDDTMFGPTPDAQPTCAERWEAIMSAHVTWMQIERVFRDGDYCPEKFQYVTLLRNPINLMESHMNSFPARKYGAIWGFVEPLKMYKIMRACLLLSTESCDRSEVHYWKNPYVHFDNYMVRVLGGPEIMKLPPKSVNATHAGRAFQMLGKFDLVFRVEDLAKMVLHEKLRRAFGWHNFSLMRVIGNSKPHTAKFTDVDLAQLKVLNKHDFMLWESVEVL